MHTCRGGIFRTETIQRIVVKAVRCWVCVHSCCVGLSTRIRIWRERIRRESVRVWIKCWWITSDWRGMWASGRADCVRSVISGEFWFIEVGCCQSTIHFGPFVGAFYARDGYHTANISHVFNEKFPSNNRELLASG